MEKNLKKNIYVCMYIYIYIYISLEVDIYIYPDAVADFILLGSKITADSDCSHEIKTLDPCKESYDKPRQHIKKQRHHFAKKGHSYGFSNSHIWM